MRSNDLRSEPKSDFVFVEEKDGGRGRRWGVAVLSLAVVAAAASYVNHVEHRSGLVPRDSGKTAADVRQTLVDRAAGRTPQFSILRVREGIERFLITDINNPAASAMAQSSQCSRRSWIGEPRRNAAIAQFVQPAHAVLDDGQPIGSGWDRFNTEGYDYFQDNPFRRVSEHPMSTFSIDVDTASYTNVRRMLDMGVRPPRDSVRIEEFINYFDYDYPIPDQDEPFSVNVEVASAPWRPEHRLVRVGLRGYEPSPEERTSCNLVFLVDVSGSMQPANKLPLVKRSLTYLVNRLGEEDRVALCVYAGAAGMVLPPTSCWRKDQILDAIARLEAGGSTNGGQGIRLAYDLAAEHYNRKAVNRVILATDGDFNVGMTDRGELIRFIEERAREGIFLTTLGFGFGNLKDSTLEQLADQGNGNYAYVDSFGEAQRVFGTKLTSTLVTIAKDVKIQIEFNPLRVEGYRLIGYENRVLAREDFNDDTKDAGEIGAGHRVTALYEVAPVGSPIETQPSDPLRYQRPPASAVEVASGDELLFLKLRYKSPNGTRSRLITRAVPDAGATFEEATPELQFAAAVASFGMLLRESPHVGTATLADVRIWAQSAINLDGAPERAELLRLIEEAHGIISHASPIQ